MIPGNHLFIDVGKKEEILAVSANSTPEACERSFSLIDDRRCESLFNLHNLLYLQNHTGAVPTRSTFPTEIHGESS
jgi:hypothetical protein